MRITSFALLLLSLLAVTPARADLHITRDHGGYVEEYKAKYARIRDHHERVPDAEHRVACGPVVYQNAIAADQAHRGEWGIVCLR